MRDLPGPGDCSPDYRPDENGSRWDETVPPFDLRRIFADKHARERAERQAAAARQTPVDQVGIFAATSATEGRPS